MFDIDKRRALIKSAYEYLSCTLELYLPDFRPVVLIICGSGLGGISNRIASDPKPLAVPYQNIPGFKTSTVKGHDGELIFGYVNKKPIVLMKGRLHGYEGYSLDETTFPIRVLHEFGSINTLIVTNASGGINDKFKTGDLMCIYDHVNFPGLCGFHPLTGPNFDEYGPRFMPTSDSYDLELRKLLVQTYKELGILRSLHEGVYMYFAGPTFESSAESRLAKMLGGDVVGMSTVPEVIVARHCKWKVLALSLITNECVIELPVSALESNPILSNSGEEIHNEVLSVGQKASNDIESLIEGVIGKL